MIRKRRRLGYLAVCLAALLALNGLVGCAPKTATEAPQETEGADVAPFKIVVADARTTHHLNLYVAKEKGFFEERGLDVEIVESADLTAARDLVVSGGADAFWSCPTVAIAAIANGAPIQAIAQVKTPCTSVLVVPADSPIKEIKDVAGKRIAGISPTCEAVISYARAARDAGVEFQLEKLAGGEAITALEGAAVDGAILEEPHVSIAELKGFKVLFPEISQSIPCRTINARNAVIESNPEEYKLFIEAIDEANQIILADPTSDEVVAIAVKYTGAPEDAIVKGNGRLKFGIELDTVGLTSLGDELVTLENIKENPGDALFSQVFKGITW